MANPKVAAPPAAKLKFCTSKIRDVAEIKVCNFKLKTHPLGGDYCPNNDNHLYPMLSGFCKAGWCEGTKARTAKGTSAPTCKFYTNCPCECHARLNRMFQIAGNERVLVNHSEWKPEFIVKIPPATLAVEPPSIEPRPDTPPPPEEPVAAILPAAIERSFGPTPTGRTARGELESWVKEETDAWAADVEAAKVHPEILIRNCTPSFVAKEVGRSQGFAPPSEGAVNAVFMRWEKLGFAVIERKPTRFAGYTPDGVKFGLDTLKARAKRAAVR